MCPVGALVSGKDHFYRKDIFAEMKPGSQVLVSFLWLVPRHLNNLNKGRTLGFCTESYSDVYRKLFFSFLESLL